MASYTASEVVALVMDDSFEGLDSGEEEITEDPSFPLPHADDDCPDEDPITLSAGVCAWVYKKGNI